MFPKNVHLQKYVIKSYDWSSILCLEQHFYQPSFALAAYFMKNRVV